MAAALRRLSVDVNLRCELISQGFDRWCVAMSPAPAHRKPTHSATVSHHMPRLEVHDHPANWIVTSNVTLHQHIEVSPLSDEQPRQHDVAKTEHAVLLTCPLCTNVRHSVFPSTKPLSQCDHVRINQGLRLCQSRDVTARRGQATSPLMWNLSSGSCVLLQDGCVTTSNYGVLDENTGVPYGHDGQPCVMDINPAWTGFLYVEYMELGYGGRFYVDGTPVTQESYRGQYGVHGTAPRESLEWSPSTSSYGSRSQWKLCQVNALPPWTVTEGDCRVNRQGCLETAYFVFRDAGYNMKRDCWMLAFESCVVEISDDWEGSLDVVEAKFERLPGPFYDVYDDFVPDILELNGEAYTVSSREDFFASGVQGMIAKSLIWREGRVNGCTGVKICPMVSSQLPGPWGDEPWTCTVYGESCILPFEHNGVTFSACTQQLSDPFDMDQDGSLHNGHPQCWSTAGLSLCGPCSCAAGEEQTYNLSSVYPHTNPAWLVTCAPCAAGRFSDSGASESCEKCAPGTSSPSGATACADCLPGMFKGYEMLECASCQPGHFGFGFGLTTCQECGIGMYTSIEQQTACDTCPVGSVLVAQDAGCQQCPPGTFRDSSMSSCSPCDAGRFQNVSGQSGCYLCSAVLDPEGPNPFLWTTLRWRETLQWQETSGSQHVSDCGCAAGAWVDALGRCQACGSGIVCKGMGEVEVLPGYFARADSAGFVWRCHGADWARCPGGRPGTCAQQRLNTSTACEECEPYARATNDGPCKAMWLSNISLLKVCVPSFSW